MLVLLGHLFCLYDQCEYEFLDILCREILTRNKKFSFFVILQLTVIENNENEVKCIFK